MAAGGLFFSAKGAFAQALTLTPAQTEGPYYPNVLPLDRDNDLLLINDSITPGVGTISWLSGRVLDRNGNPIRNAKIEIWQADNVGSYIHTQGALNGQRDSNFQGYGVFETASDGAYLFRTIKPGLYPGRVRHVHSKITLPGGRSLTTQLYIEGETGTNDGVLNGVPAAQRSAVVKAWTPIANSPIGALAVKWDIVMDFTPAETPTPTRPTLVSMAGVTHGTTLRVGAASGSFVTLFGDALSTTTRSWGASDFVNGRLPESLDGVRVSINNLPAAVNYISPKQINVIAPEAVADGNVQVTVTNSAGTSDAVTVAFSRFSPAFFQFLEENVAAVRADGSLIGRSGLFSGVASAPARPGETIVLYGSGFGATSPATPYNQIVNAPVPLANTVKVLIDGKTATVSFAGVVSAGLCQFNVTVPDLPDGEYPVVAEVAGVRTGKFVKLAVARQTSAAASIGSGKPDPLNAMQYVRPA
jgi:protocatechuate 3,4-dioxygenase beta subunit